MYSDFLKDESDEEGGGSDGEEAEEEKVSIHDYIPSFAGGSNVNAVKPKKKIRRLRTRRTYTASTRSTY